MKLLLFLILVSSAVAEPLVLDHDMLTSMVRTREPEARIEYTATRIEIRTRRSILVGWMGVLLTANFERRGSQVQLIGRSLRAGAVSQTGRRLEEARAGLLKLVNVKTEASSVEIRRGGKVVFTQTLEGAKTDE